MSTDPQRTTGRWLAIFGGICQLAFVVALFRLAPYLGNFFLTLVRGGVGDPSSLIGALQEFFEYCAVEFTVGLTGLVCLGVSLAVCGYHARWFSGFLTVYGALLLFVFPVGTAFGIFFLVYCRTFHPRESA